MILAAGRGTRLRPLTDTTPKLLVEVGGKTLYEHVAGRLVDAGADRLIVNVHHHAAQIERHVEAVDFGVEVRISHEEERPLGTGGGVLRAAPLFRRDAGPFLLHTGDVISEIDLAGLFATQRGSDALATLAVHERETSRFFLFDSVGLVGWESVASGESRRVRPPDGEVRRFAFSGVHAIDPRFLDLIEERGAFSIVDSYLRLAAAGHRILARDVTGARWLEIGNPERLAAARRALGG